MDCFESTTPNYQTDLPTANRFELLATSDIEITGEVEACDCGALLHSEECMRVREESDNSVFNALFDSHQIEAVWNDDPDVVCFASTFNFEGMGRIPFTLDGFWWRHVDTNIVFNFPPQEILFLDEQFVSAWYKPFLGPSLAMLEQELCRRINRAKKSENKRRRAEENELLMSSIIENRELERELLRMRDYDRAAGRVFPALQCAIRGCTRVVTCDVCQRCLCHARRGCGCVDSDTREAARCDKAPARFSGTAQSLFGVDVGPINVNHLISIPVVSDFIKELTSIRSDLSWKRIVSEAFFFLFHLKRGGIDLSNVIVSGTQLSIHLGLADRLDWQELAERLPNAQSSGGITSGLTLAVTGIMVLFSLLLTSKLPDDKSIDRLISRFGQIGRCITSCEKLTQYSDAVAKLFIDFIKVQVFGFSSEDLDEWRDIDKLCDEVVALNTPQFEKMCTEDLTVVSKVNELLQRADVIQKRLDALKVHPSAYVRFTKCSLFLQRAREICSSVSSGSLRPRVAPLVIHVHGATGVGKSSMLDYLNTQLLIALGSTNPDDLQNKVYYRYPTSDFFDGYRNGTDIVVCDDFGSAKDSESHPSSEPLEQIRMTNTAPFRPPMAHLNDKANTCFEAKVVIWTSNRPTFSFPSLTNPEAVHNRVHLRFEQTVSPEFRIVKNIDGKNVTCLDGEKVAAFAESRPNVWRECMQFQQQTVEGKPRPDGTYETVGPVLSFEEFAQKCVIALKRKQGIGNDMLSEQRRYFAEQLQGRAQSNFYTPGRIGRMCGLLTHVDVWATMIEMADPVRVKGICKSLMPVGARRQVAFQLRESGFPCCIACEPDKEAQVIELLHQVLYNTVYDADVAGVLEQLTLVGYFCFDHVNYTAEASFWESVDRVRRQVKITTVEAGMSLLRTIGDDSLLSGVACGLLSMSIYALTSWLFSFISGAMKQLFTGEEESKAAGLSCMPTGRVERYAQGLSISQTGKVEAYSSGISVHPQGSVESTGQAESITDVNAAEVRRKAFHNTYLISGIKAEQEYALGTLTMLVGRIGLTNRHIMWDCKTLDKVKISSSNGQEYIFPSSELNWAFVPDTDTVHGHRDVAVVEFPRTVHLHSDIRTHFMTAEDFCRHTELERVSLIAHRSVAGQPRLIFIESNACKAWQRESFDLRASEHRLQVREFYTYAMETTYGDCGGILVAFDKRFSRKIVGIHMAGIDNNKLYSSAGCAVSQEFLGKLLDQLQLRWPHSIINNTVCVDRPIEVTTKGDELVFEGGFNGNFVNVGTAHSRVYSAKTSTITPSPVADLCGPVRKKPAYLTRGVNGSGEVIDPLALAMSKARTPALSVEPTALAAATAHVAQMIVVNIKEGDNTPLSFEEAVKGREGDEAFPALNRSTSPGHGWKKRGKGKTAWLGSDSYDLTNAELLHSYEDALSRLDSGLRVGRYWTDTLKDELRPIEKVEAGKTRLFSAGEMVTTILLRQHFMGFAAHMARNKIDVEACIGINPYGLDWTILANKLRLHGQCIVAGDFTNYDGTLPADVLWAVFDIVDQFYRESPHDTEQLAMRRRLLWCEIVNSVHISGDIVYMWNHSQPSGCPFTSVLNSVVHSVIIRVVYILCARKYCPELVSLNNFSRYVSHVNYGDDDVTNISVDIIPWFNQVTMAEMYKTFGMTYTDESKSNELVPFKKLEEVQFLKRAFVWDEKQSRFRAPLDINTVLEMPCWNKTRGDKWSLTALVLEDAVRELAQHDQETWNRHIGKFEIARKFIYPHVAVQFPTFEELQFEDVSKYFGYVKVNSQNGARQQSSSSALQQILLESDCGLQGYPQSGWEGYSPLLACVRPTKTIGYTPDVPSHRPELTGKRHESVGDVAKQLSNNDQIATMSSAMESNGQNPDFAGAEKQVQVKELMTFHQDGVVEEQAPVQTKMQKVVDDGAHDWHENAVQNFLMRPIQMTTFDWLASTAVAGHLVTLDLPKDWLNLKMIQEKVAGFRYLRCDLVIEVQVNAQPFNAGMGLVWFEPLAAQQTYAPSNIGHLGGITGYPCAYYRCGEATSVQLRIPYQATQSHFDLVAATGTMGKVRFTVLSPLTGAADVDGTVWAWAENVSIQMPTGVPQVFTQTMLSGPAQSGQEAEVADVPKQDATSRERKGRGPIELALKITSGMFSAAALAPPLTAIAGVGAAVFGAASSVASFFGWSKPLNSEQTAHFRPIFCKHMTNATGGADCRVLALDARNTQDIPIEVFGTEKDEMAFETLLARPTYMDRFQFASTALQGQVLWKWPVHPRACVKTNASKSRALPLPILTVNYVQMQPSLLSYVSWSALKWRGSIDYQIKIVKTPFHSGRLRVTFVPGATMATDVNLVDLAKCYSTVVDLRQETDIEFSVPYVSNTPFMQMSDNVLAADPGTALTYGYPTGMIYVSVVNALRNPSTAASSIDCLVFVKAGHDFQLAFPKLEPRLKVLERASDVATLAFSGDAQSGFIDAKSQAEPFDANQIAIGEVYTGFRQWLKRYIPLPEQVIQGGMTGIFPHRMPDNKAGEDFFDTYQDSFTPHQYAAYLYRYLSGSMRVLLENKLTTSYRAAFYPGIETATIDTDGIPKAIVPPEEKLAEFEVPLYGHTCATITAVGAMASNTATGYSPSGTPYSRVGVAQIPYLYTQRSANQLEYSVAFGEMTSLGLQIGPPVIFIAKN